MVVGLLFVVSWKIDVSKMHSCLSVTRVQEGQRGSGGLNPFTGFKQIFYDLTILAALIQYSQPY